MLYHSWFSHWYVFISENFILAQITQLVSDSTEVPRAKKPCVFKKLNNEQIIYTLTNYFHTTIILGQTKHEKNYLIFLPKGCHQK
jgi:hypothetical protein